MLHYTAAQLRNAWKPTMSRLGFRIDHSRFVTSHGPINHSVVFQRLQWSPDVLVKLFVSVMANRPNPLCWNDPFPFQQGIEAIGCEVLERLNFPGRPADLQRLNLLCRP